MTRALILMAVATVLLGVAVGWYVMMGRSGDQFAACQRGAVAGGAAEIGGPFELLNGDGALITQAEAIDRPSLVYFGYTFCPDFCPNDLSRNAIAADILAEDGVDVGLVFISVDPDRDTPEVVTDYAQSIHPDLLGLTGDEKQVATAANAYRVYYGRADDDPEFYLMDHSTFTYLMDPELGFLEFYVSDTSPEDMAESVACFVSRL